MKRTASLLAGVVAISGMTGAAMAQPYPSKTIRVVVPCGTQI